MIRIVGHPKYPGAPGSPAVAAGIVAQLRALAVTHGGRLATFDRRLSVKAVKGLKAALLVIDG